MYDYRKFYKNTGKRALFEYLSLTRYSLEELSYEGPFQDAHVETLIGWPSDNPAAGPIRDYLDLEDDILKSDLSDEEANKLIDEISNTYLTFVDEYLKLLNRHVKRMKKASKKIKEIIDKE